MPPVPHWRRRFAKCRNSDFKRFIYDDLATSCKHLVNFSPVTPEFKRVKGVHLSCVLHPSSISSLVTFALLLDLVGISTDFSGAVTTQFHLCARGRHCYSVRAIR